MGNVVSAYVQDVEERWKEMIVRHIRASSKAKPVSASQSVVKGYIDGYVCRKNPSKGKCKSVGK